MCGGGQRHMAHVRWGSAWVEHQDGAEGERRTSHLPLYMCKLREPDPGSPGSVV